MTVYGYMLKKIGYVGWLNNFILSFSFYFDIAKIRKQSHSFLLQIQFYYPLEVQ